VKINNNKKKHILIEVYYSNILWINVKQKKKYARNDFV